MERVTDPVHPVRRLTEHLIAMGLLLSSEMLSAGRWRHGIDWLYPEYLEPSKHSCNNFRFLLLSCLILLFIYTFMPFLVALFQLGSYMRCHLLT